MTTALNREFERLGLMRSSIVAKTLRIDNEVLRYLIRTKQLQMTVITWKGIKYSGMPAKDLEGTEVVKRDGRFVVERKGQPS